MPVDNSIKMEQDQQQHGMQLCTSYQADMSGGAAAAWMQAPSTADYQQQHDQQQQQAMAAAAAAAAQMQGYADSFHDAAAAVMAMQHAGGHQPGAELHPGMAGTGESLQQMMSGNRQQPHPASVGGLPGTLLVDQGRASRMEPQMPDVMMHPAAALPDDMGVDAAAVAAAAGGVNGLLPLHTVSTGGPDLVPHPGAGGGMGPGPAAAAGAMGGWGQPQPSQSQSDSVGLDTSNVEQHANTHQHDQRQHSGLRSSGANTGSQAGGNKKQ